MITLYGKDSAISSIRSYQQSGRMPHAILFLGEMGIGKGTMAEYLAAQMTCERGGIEPCGSCNSCYKADKRIHPDIVFAKQMCDDEKYKVDVLRKVLASAALRPNDGEVRVLIFEDADTMSPQCQNTLLKFIEEPQPFNKIILTASSARQILPTVISRVTALTLDEASESECVLALGEQGITPEDAQTLVNTFGGNIGLCLQNAGEEIPIEIITAKKIAKGLIEKNEFVVATALAALRTRESLDKTLLLLLEILRDSIFVKIPYSRLFSCDRAGARALSNAYTERSLVAAINEVQTLIEQFRFNPNLQLALTESSSRIFVAMSE